MSYNGIGLSTARGSGTNGFIQKNNTNSSLLTAYKRRQQSKKYSESQKSKLIRQKDEGLLNHAHKRAIDLEVSEYRDKLEDEHKLNDEEVDVKVKELRHKLVRDYRLKHEVQYLSRKEREERDDESVSGSTSDKNNKKVVDY